MRASPRVRRTRPLRTSSRRLGHATGARATPAPDQCRAVAALRRDRTRRRAGDLAHRLCIPRIAVPGTRRVRLARPPTGSRPPTTASDPPPGASPSPSGWEVLAALLHPPCSLPRRCRTVIAPQASAPRRAGDETATHDSRPPAAAAAPHLEQSCDPGSSRPSSGAGLSARASQVGDLRSPRCRPRHLRPRRRPHVAMGRPPQTRVESRQVARSRSEAKPRAKPADQTPSCGFTEARAQHCPLCFRSWTLTDART